MVEPLLPATPAGVSRRGVLAGAGGLVTAPLLVGCSLGEVGQAVRRGAGPDAPPTPTPDVRVATRALEAVLAAREHVTATVARHPGLAGTLAPLVAVHRAHEASLVDAVPRSAVSPTTTAPTPSPSASAGPTATAAPTATSTGPTSTTPTSTAPTSTAPASTATATPAVPRSRARALAAVVALEDRLHADLDGLAMRAQSGDFARLLAAMGAALAQRRAGVTG